MGETAAETREEIEETRAELSGTLDELRSRASDARSRATGALAIGVGVVAGAAAVVASVLIVRKRRGGPITRAARRLPDPARPTAVPAARATERFMSRRAKRLQEQRAELVDMVAKAIAEQQAQAQRKADPLWRRTAAKALETTATVGVGTVIPRLIRERRNHQAAEE